MSEALNGSRRQPARADLPAYVVHESFGAADAEERFGPEGAWPAGSAGHMADDVTRDTARRMHYAAWRTGGAQDERERAGWRAAYLRLRDAVVLGNRKLVFRAVRRWSPPASLADDLVGDCQVVLIQAVAAYNPWIGVRFSTYAFTCLMRALSRLSQKHAADRMGRGLPLEALPEGEPPDPAGADPASGPAGRLDELLRGADLLSLRERRVIARRFRLDEGGAGGTLAQVGRELGLSKERVRQVQASALDKLRKALSAGASPE